MRAPTPRSDAPIPGPTPAIRAFVLMAWSPQLGAAVDPVGALALTPAGEWRVAWVPLAYGQTAGWRETLAAADDVSAHLGGWLDAAGTRQLVEVPAPPAASPREAADCLLDEILAAGVP